MQSYQQTAPSARTVPPIQDATPADASAAEVSLGQIALELASVGGSLAGDVAALAKAELRLSLQASLQYAIAMITCTFLCALLWLGLCAAGGVIIAEQTTSVLAGSLFFILTQLGGIAVLLHRLRQLRARIGFRASQQALGDIATHIVGAEKSDPGESQAEKWQSTATQGG